MLRCKHLSLLLIFRRYGRLGKDLMRSLHRGELLRALQGLLIHEL